MYNSMSFLFANTTSAIPKWLHAVAIISLLHFVTFTLGAPLKPVDRPTLLHHTRQVEQPQQCANTLTWPYQSNYQTTPADCTAAATQLCAMIPLSSWTVNGWTTTNVNNCRAMVYHDTHMPVPSQTDCLTTFGNIITTCITETPQRIDAGTANENESNNGIAADPTKTVYQIGAGGYWDKCAGSNGAMLAGSISQFGAGAGHATFDK